MRTGLPSRRLAGPLAAVVVVASLAALVVAMRAAHTGPEPARQNWWLVAEVLLAVAALPVGVLLLQGRQQRVLGGLLIGVAAAVMLDVVATQYAASATSRPGDVPDLPALAAAHGWSWSVATGLLAGVVPLFLPVGRPTPSRLARTAAVVAGGSTAAAALPGLTATWPWASTSNPLAAAGSLGDVLGAVGTGGRWGIGAAAALSLGLLARRLPTSGARATDLLPLWLLTGAVVGALAVVPTLAPWATTLVPEDDVVLPLLVVSTVPLLLVGVLIESERRGPRSAGVPTEEMTSRVIEWTLLAAGIALIYTVLVAGLGRLVGGSGPTWLLVAATGAIALVLEPARRHIRTVVDRLVYGSRDDALVVVRDVITQVSGAVDVDDLLPSLAQSIAGALRLDWVAIDRRDGSGWERAASAGEATSTVTTVVLRHHDEVVGRLLAGCSVGPPLRTRDVTTLGELAGPVALALTWVRLTDDLRQAHLATVSAREEERRRLRRDLHDGLGPALTGISLGLRSTIRKFSRSRRDHEDEAVELLERLADEIDAAVGEVRRIARDLRPSALDQLGLTGAITAFSRTLQPAVDVHLELPDEDRPPFPAALEVAIYRIVTEALTNVVRHASARRCWVRVVVEGGVAVDVVDDGWGRHPPTPGVGIAAMRERTSELGGSFELFPRMPHGTCVHAVLPELVP